jgi:hypothetical protein
MTQGVSVKFSHSPISEEEIAGFDYEISEK